MKIRLRLEATSDSKRVVADMKRLPAELRTALDNVGMQCAEVLARGIRDAILLGELNLPARTPEWARRAGTPITLVHTRKYVNGIRAVKTGRGEYGVTGDEKMYRLHEYGVPHRNLPPRPHWAPTLHKMEPVIEEMVKREVERVVAGR